MQIVVPELSFLKFLENLLSRENFSDDSRVSCRRNQYGGRVIYENEAIVRFRRVADKEVGIYMVQGREFSSRECASKVGYWAFMHSLRLEF